MDLGHSFSFTLFSSYLSSKKFGDVPLWCDRRQHPHGSECSLTVVYKLTCRGGTNNWYSNISQYSFLWYWDRAAISLTPNCLAFCWFVPHIIVTVVLTALFSHHTGSKYRQNPRFFTYNLPFLLSYIVCNVSQVLHYITQSRLVIRLQAVYRDFPSLLQCDNLFTW